MNLRIFLVSILVSIPASAFALQVPFKPGLAGWQESTLGGENHTDWDLNKLPHPNSTDHLVFETVHSLLQHWPNVRMRNGHNIVPGSIPKGTLLYRGSGEEELPPGPDWIAIDPEHAYIFCGETPPATGDGYTSHGCWHLTMVATRALKVIYFDGSGAAKLPYGSLDTQDLLAWGKPSSGTVSSERYRIKKLCEWGKRFGVDAFVRMEVDFEAMLCDFTSGVKVASLANLAGWRSMPSGLASIRTAAIESGSWQNHFPGETRIQLDLTGLVSFYDTKLASSLVPIRAGKERWDHRVGDVSSEDLAFIKARLEANLVRPSGPSSGIDWRSLFRVIVDRFAGRLELTRHLLDTLPVHPDEILDLANKTHTQLRIMLTPYILLSVTPTYPLNNSDLNWTIPVYEFCATIHTQFMESELDSMTDAERLLFRSVRGTSQEICRVVTKMWAAGVYAGLDPSLNTKDSLDIAEISLVSSKWAEDLNGLMAWLDWSVWVKCNPECGPEEICYLPTWPYGFPWFGGGEPPWHLELQTERENAMEDELDGWAQPQPRCISRVTPYYRFLF